MAASGIIASTGAADTSAALFTPYFEGYSSPMAQCDGITLQSGPEPSYALARVPLAAIDDTAPAVAAVTNGPLYATRVLSDCLITDHNGTKILKGTVTQITHLIGDRAGEDAGVCLIEDARRQMKKFPIIGSFWRSGSTASPVIRYRAGWPPIFNQGSQPNCFFVGNVPVFCEPNFGLLAGQSPADMDTSGASTATYWSNQTILVYLRYIATDGVATAQAAFSKYPSSLSSIVNWPAGYASAIAQPVTVTPPNGNVPMRKALEVNFDSANLCDAVTQMLHAEGSWDLYITPGNSVAVVPTKFTSGGSTIYCPTGDANTEFAKPKVITGGVLVENGENLYKTALSAGEITCIETRISSYAASEGLENAWSTADQERVRVLAQDSYNAGFGLQESINMAISFFPNVLKTYRLVPTYDFQAGTSEAGKSLAQVGRPVLDTLLSTKLEGNAGAGTTATAQYRYRMPTQFEYYQENVTPPAIPDWHAASIADGFTTATDGTIQVIGLLTVGSTYETQESGDFPNKVLTLTARKMRITVAIPCDHRLTASALSPLGENDRISNQSNSTYYATTNLYAREIRGGSVPSWPVPESCQPAHTAASSGDLRNDSQYLQSHANRRADVYTRLVRGGQFVCPNMTLAYDVGQQLSIFTGSRNGFPIRSVIRRIELKCGPGEQSQILHTDDVGYVGYDELPEMTQGDLQPAAYTPNTSDKSSQTAPKADAYKPESKEPDYSVSYAPNLKGPALEYDATRASPKVENGPTQESTTKAANANVLADEEEDAKGKGAAKDVSTLSSSNDPYSQFKTKYTEAPKENAPLANTDKGRGDDALRREFGI